MINYLFEIDLNGERTKYTDVVFTTGDVRGYRLTFVFKEGKKPFDASGYTLFIKAKRADGSVITDSGVLDEEGRLCYDVKNSMISLCGELSFEIALASESGMYVTTKELTASVRSGYGEADLEAADKTPVLSALLSAAQSAQSMAQEARAAAYAAEEAAAEAHVRIDELSDVISKMSVTYGVSVDLSNSNPETAVTYFGDAVGMAAGSDDWYKMNIFKDIKPCLFKDGAVVGYLNPDNFAQFEDGTAADITSGDSGDVMIEIPKTGYKITKSGGTLTVQITNEENKEGFSYMAHTRETEGDREKLYVGAFLAGGVSGRLRSLSGALPLNTETLGECRSMAQAGGTGYDLLSFYPLTLLQCLYLIKYKNLNSQLAVGMGYVEGDEPCMTGTTVEKGMDYGTSSGTEQMKFLGIEDFWGNLKYWIDGLVSSSTRNALVATENFNDTGDGYTDIGQMCASNTFGWMKAPQGTNEAGFIISVKGGSVTTYFSDYSTFYNSRVSDFGGSYFDDLTAGAFAMNMYYSSDSRGDGFCGARLMFL